MKASSEIDHHSKPEIASSCFKLWHYEPSIYKQIPEKQNTSGTVSRTTRIRAAVSISTFLSTQIRLASTFISKLHILERALSLLNTQCANYLHKCYALQPSIHSNLADKSAQALNLLNFPLFELNTRTKSQEIEPD